jgi:hypothetical protein
MGYDNRRWTTEGSFRAIGTTVDGRSARTITVHGLEGETPVQRRAFVTGLVAELNAHGGPQLTKAQRAVLDAVTAHEAEHTWPADAGDIAQTTGYTRQWVYQVWDQLVALGLGTREPRNPSENKPFRTLAHQGADR